MLKQMILNKEKIVQTADIKHSKYARQAIFQIKSVDDMLKFVGTQKETRRFLLI